MHLSSVQAAEDPAWRPDPEDIAYAEHLLEATYYRRDVRKNEESTQERRRENGRTLLDLCLVLSSALIRVMLDVCGMLVFQTLRDTHFARSRELTDHKQNCALVSWLL